ncbi:MAG TPA: KH domain-containing protein [archaeon]|nr:KH domain-containing protein [archaeon]
MKLTMKEILLMNALTSVSKVSPKDCIVENNIVTFLVNSDEVGKAIGKKAINVKELESKLKKRIEIIGFYEKPEIVIEKTFDALSTSVKEGKEKVVIMMDGTNKRKVLGNFSRFKRVKELIKRNYGVEIVLV